MVWYRKSRIMVILTAKVAQKTRMLPEILSARSRAIMIIVLSSSGTISR